MSAKLCNLYANPGTPQNAAMYVPYRGATRIIQIWREKLVNQDRAIAKAVIYPEDPEVDPFSDMKHLAYIADGVFQFERGVIPLSKMLSPSRITDFLWLRENHCLCMIPLLGVKPQLYTWMEAMNQIYPHVEFFALVAHWSIADKFEFGFIADPSVAFAYIALGANRTYDGFLTGIQEEMYKEGT